MSECPNIAHELASMMQADPIEHASGYVSYDWGGEHVQFCSVQGGPVHPPFICEYERTWRQCFRYQRGVLEDDLD